MKRNPNLPALEVWQLDRKEKLEPRSKPTHLNTPCMTLAFSKITRGENAGLMTEIAKAAVEECDRKHVSESTLVLSMFTEKQITLVNDNVVN